MDMGNDHQKNMLFGLLAARMGKISQEQLRQIAAEWSADPSQDVPTRLMDAGLLSPQDRETVAEQLDDVARTLPAGIPGAQDPATSADASLGGIAGTFAGGAEVHAAPDEEGIPAVEEAPNRYEEVTEYARGGMGRILLVQDHFLGRQVALKELLARHLAQHGTAQATGAPSRAQLSIPAVARFLQEARITGQLEHPSIVPLYELGYRADGTLYYTMRLVRGHSLHDALRICQSLEERLGFLTHFLQVCHAIAYAHSRGVIHRDIKPMNIMVGEFGETVVIDWGIAKVRGGQDIHAAGIERDLKRFSVDTGGALLTQAGTAMGSPYYMPPEQARGAVDAIDERSDVYALGTVLYQVLTGEPPYRGMNVRQFFKAVGKEPPAAIQPLAPDAPAELAAICERAMRPEPAARYPSAKELAADIQHFLSGKLVGAYAYRLSDHIRRYIKKHKALITTIGAAAVVLAAVGVYSYARVVSERNTAIEARHDAETARDHAEQARQAETSARREAQQELYFSNMALTERLIAEPNMAAARELLAAGPAAYRDWEWGRLMAMCHAEAVFTPATARGLDFSADGARLAVCSAGGIITLRDASDGSVVQTVAERPGVHFAAAYAPDAPRMALANGDGVWVWDTETGAELFAHRYEENAQSQHLALAIDPAGRRAAALGSDGQVRVWDIERGSELYSFEPDPSPAVTLAFAPDSGGLLAASTVFTTEGFAGIFELRGADTGEVRQAAELPAPLYVTAARFSPSGRYAALGTDRVLLLWDMQAWRSVAQLPVRAEQARALAFDPAERWLVAGAAGGALHVWDLASNAELLATQAHQGAVRAVVFTRDGAKMATTSADKTAIVWDTRAAPRPLATLRGHDEAVDAAAFDPQGGRLCTGGAERGIRIWDVGADLLLDELHWTTFDPASGRLVGTCEMEAAWYEPVTGRVQRRFTGHEGRIKEVALSRGGNRLVTVANEQPSGDERGDVVRVWDMDTAEMLFNAVVTPGGVSAAGFDEALERLYVQAGAKLLTYDVADGLSNEVPDAHAFDFVSGGALAVGGPQEGLRLLDREGAVQPLDGAQALQSVTLRFSPDGQRLAAGMDVPDGDSPRNLLQVFDTASGAPLMTLEGHASQTIGLAFSSDGRLLASSHRDRAVRIWDLDAQTLRAELRGHSFLVNDMAFNEAGTRMITASEDGTFKLWDAVTGRMLLNLHDAALSAPGETSTPRIAAFGPQDAYAVTVTQPRVLAPAVLPARSWETDSGAGGS